MNGVIELSDKLPSKIVLGFEELFGVATIIAT